MIRIFVRLRFATKCWWRHC